MKIEMQNPFLIGKKAYLRGLESSDLAGDYKTWFNNQDVTRFMFNGGFPNSEAKMKSFFDRVTQSETDLVLAIIHKKDNIHIGNIGLHHIHPIYRCAELGIIIGNPKYQGQNIGLEAVKLILAHGFKRLNLHKVYLMTDCKNVSAVKTFESAGFKKEGLLRESCFRDGKYEDSFYMGCLAKEFL